METPNYRKASIYFDDETVLEVQQRGGGGSGVGGENGLAAINLVTGESTNAALAEKDETIEEQAGTIEQQEATIETQAGTISDLEDEVAAKQAIIDAFPTIEALNVTANGTYSETGKAYNPVNVDVPQERGRLIPETIIFNHNIHNRRNSAVSFNVIEYPYSTPGIPGIGGIGVITITPNTTIAANTTAQYPSGGVTPIQGAQDRAPYLAILHPASHIYSIESGTATIRETNTVNINGGDFKISVIVTTSTDPVTIAID